MSTSRSVEFFDAQFRRQIRDGQFELNPFERLALAHLGGRILDYGCGLGNLAIAAARRGCSVVALDASPAAIDHVREVARAESLAIEASLAELRDHAIEEAFDATVCIGLLMFFDCDTAGRLLARLQESTKPGGVAIVNVLVEGTTYMDMFDPSGHCLFEREELARRFGGWEILERADQDFDAPGGLVKSFVTMIARKPGADGR